MLGLLVFPQQRYLERIPETPMQLIPRNLRLVASALVRPGGADMVCYISNTPRSTHDSHLD